MSHTLVRAVGGLLLLSTVGGCEQSPTPPGTSTGDRSSKAQTNQAGDRGGDAKPITESEEAGPAVKKAQAVTFECPSGMNKVPAGKFWVGTAREVFDREENPRFETRVAGFCADVYEVSTKEFEACVAAGNCEPMVGRNKTCNTVKKGRANHPINCIDHSLSLIHI